MSSVWRGPRTDSLVFSSQPARHRVNREVVRARPRVSEATLSRVLGRRDRDASEPTSALPNSLFEHPTRRVLPAPGSDVSRSARPEGCYAFVLVRAAFIARRPRAEARERRPKGSGPLDPNEAGGWRVFTTRVSALEDRTTVRGAFFSPRPSMRSAAGTPVASSDFARAIEPDRPERSEAAEADSARPLVKRWLAFPARGT